MTLPLLLPGCCFFAAVATAAVAAAVAYCCCCCCCCCCRGERVLVAFDIACGQCFFCNHGYQSSCDHTNPSKVRFLSLFCCLVSATGWWFVSLGANPAPMYNQYLCLF
jgi:hypothetical protein